jgi:hypothetical protein
VVYVDITPGLCSLFHPPEITGGILNRFEKKKSLSWSINIRQTHWEQETTEAEMLMK